MKKTLTDQDVENFCDYNFDWNELVQDMENAQIIEGTAGDWGELRKQIIRHIDMSVVLEWIKDNLKPVDVFGDQYMEEYDYEVLQEAMEDNEP